jgi:hypothetical protein
MNLRDEKIDRDDVAIVIRSFANIAKNLRNLSLRLASIVVTSIVLTSIKMTSIVMTDVDQDDVTCVEIPQI